MMHRATTSSWSARASSGCAVGPRALRGSVLDGEPLRVALVEARGDVGDVTSKANTAIPQHGLRRDALLARRRRLVHARLRAAVGVRRRRRHPVEHVGACAGRRDRRGLATSPSCSPGAGQRLRARRAHRRRRGHARTAPHLGEGALGGLVIPDESIISLDERSRVRHRGGVVPRRRPPAAHHGHRRARRRGRRRTSTPTAGELEARWLVNAAGLGIDRIDAMLGL